MVSCHMSHFPFEWQFNLPVTGIELAVGQGEEGRLSLKASAKLAEPIGTLAEASSHFNRYQYHKNFIPCNNEYVVLH